MTRRPVLLALAVLAACNTGFDPQYRVADTRILDVRGQVQGAPATADAAPGDTLVLEALVARPRDGTRVSWFGCLPAASEAVTPCQDRSFLDDPRRLRTDPSVLFIGATEYPAAGAEPDLVASTTWALVDPAVSTSALEAAIDFRVAPAVERPSFQCRLYAELLVIAMVEAPPARPTAAVKRVRLTSASSLARHGFTMGPPPGGDYNLNLNPTVAAVRRDSPDGDACTGGTPLAGGDLPGGRRPICAAGDAGQAIWICDADGRSPSTEDYGWQWYATAGEFPDASGGIGNATGKSIDFVRPAGPFSLWAIARDQRGGTAWRRLDFGAAP